MSQITPQLTNMWDKSHESWFVKDKKLRFIYANKEFVKLSKLPEDSDILLKNYRRHLIILLTFLKNMIVKSYSLCNEYHLLLWLILKAMVNSLILVSVKNTH